jgi:hypothetical protein
MADADEVECWASMADAFDFGDAVETARDASACTVPVPVLERVEHAAAASGTESLESLATRFASEFRSKSPCVTRRAAAQWMSGSRIGRGGGEAVFGAQGAARDVPVVLLERPKDGRTFLGRGELCSRVDGVPAHEAWARVRRGNEPRASARASTASDRCYFRAPLGPELREDLDFRAARTLFGGDSGKNECVFDDASGNALPSPFSEKTASLWCSSRGSVTPTHFDLCHGFLTQIRGRKRVLLVPPEHTRSMYRADPSGVNPNSSPVDLALFVTGLEHEKNARRFSEAEKKLSDSERARFPKTRVALGEIREVTLWPGDTLYIPPFWWHHVVTLETLERDSDVFTESISREKRDEREKNDVSDEDDVSVSLLLAFDPVGDESVHPCVDEEG